MSSPTAALQATRAKHHAKRKRVNALALALSLAAMAFGLFWLVWILFTTLELGVAGLSLDLFTKMTPPPNSTQPYLLRVRKAISPGGFSDFPSVEIDEPSLDTLSGGRLRLVVSRAGESDLQ